MFGYPFSSRQPRRTSGTDISVAVSLAVLQILIAVILTLISLMEQFNVDPCGFSRDCDFDLLTRSALVTPLAAVGALLLEGVPVALLVRRGSRIWWVPAVGIVVVIVGYVVAHVLNAVATQLMEELERKSRELGLDALRLDTRTDLVEARSLYASLGFIEGGGAQYGPLREPLVPKRTAVKT